MKQAEFLMTLHSVLSAIELVESPRFCLILAGVLGIDKDDQWQNLKAFTPT
jgi:hypothetical protein